MTGGRPGAVAQGPAPLQGPALRAAVLAAEPGADLEGASVLGEGWACVAYRVPAPAGDLALRVPKPDSWWAAPDLERESALLPALERWGLPVPRDARLLRGADGAVLGALQTVIEGSPAAPLPRGHARARFALDVGAFLARLHALPVGEVRALGVREPGMWDGHYAPMIEQASARLPRASSHWLTGRAQTFLEEGGVASAPSALIHADCSRGNLLIGDDGALSGVIDWADAMIGDPALDFAALQQAYPRAVLGAIMDGYERAGGELDGDWQRRADFYLDAAPVFGVLFADDAGFPAIARADRRRFAAAARRAMGGR